MKTWQLILLGAFVGLLMGMLFVFLIDPSLNGLIIYPVVHVSTLLARHFHFYPDVGMTDYFIFFVPLSALYFASIGICFVFTMKYCRRKVLSRIQ